MVMIETANALMNLRFYFRAATFCTRTNARKSSSEFDRLSHPACNDKCSVLNFFPCRNWRRFP